MAARILIVYGSSYGQTAKIANRIGDLLRAEGEEITVCKGDTLEQSLPLETYDGIILGASLIGGKYQKYIRSFVTRHRGALHGVPTAFFAVSGSAGGTEKEQQAARDKIAEFLRATGWKPSCVASIAGAICYTRYNPLLRWIMKHMMAREGRPSDTSRDYEFTNWEQVAEFAREFNALVNPLVTAAT
jgi:menaquinone-dependent protoporphyrinogen oxidase